MKKITLFVLFAVLGSSVSFGQEEEKKGEPDTTRINLGQTEIIIIEKKGKDTEVDEGDGIEEENPIPEKPKKEAHWAGVDFGFSVLMDQNMNTSFTDYPYWKNDPARSQTWNLNLLEHKFNIAKHYMGLTTGLGFSFTSTALRDNYLLNYTVDTLNAYIDTVNSYRKNKLKATYLTVPLMLEFNTNENPNKSFYLAAGVVGGVRIASKVKRIGEYDGKEFKEKLKGTYGLNSFKLDAAVRLGYADWGVFANYSLLPLFETDKTTEVYPVTFGLSYNF